MELEDALLALGSTDPDVRAAALQVIAEHVLGTTSPSLMRSSWPNETVEEATHLMLLELCQRDRPMIARHPTAYLRTILRNACNKVYGASSKRNARQSPPLEEHELEHALSLYEKNPKRSLTHLPPQTIVPEDAFDTDSDTVIRIIAAHMAEVVAPSMDVREDAMKSTVKAIGQLTDLYTGEYTMDELIASNCTSDDPSATELRQARDKLNRSFSRARERLLITLEAPGGDLEARDGDHVLMHRFIQSVMSRARANSSRTSG